jgi:hypothetical protein
MASLAASKKEEDMTQVAEPDYESQDVDMLLERHKGDITKLKDLLGDELPAVEDKYPFFDDIWYLRYILSMKTAEGSVEPIRKTLQWRKEPKIIDMCEKIGNETWEETSICQTSFKYQVAGEIPAKVDNGPFVIIRPGKSNSSALYDNLSFDELHMLHYAYREHAFRQCDRETRSSRKIVKQLLIFDMNGVSFSDMTDRRGQKVFEPVSKNCANYYPQLQSKFVMINAPSWIAVIFSLMKRIMPARNFAKVGFCPAKGTDKPGADASKCPFASKFLDLSKLPKFLGGEMDEKELPGLLTGALLDDPENSPDKNRDGWKDMSISRRSKKTVDLMIPAGDITVQWRVNVASYGIKLHAELLKLDQPEVVLQNFRQAASDEEKIKAENGVGSGSWVCKSPGLLRVTFDNSYSMIRGKSLRYKLDICADDAEVKEAR